MDFETIDMGCYRLHLIKTKKFKTITIDVNFYREIKKEEITKRNLLKMVLLNSSKEYKTERKLIKESESLYDIKVSSSISRIGLFSNLSFQTKFLNEKYTKEGMNEESIIFFLDLIFNPNIKLDAFENVEIQKKKLKEDIMSLKDNKIRYSMLKLMEKMKDMPYSYNTFGSIEDLDKIDGKVLYDYYKSVLREDKIDVFVLGDIDEVFIKKIFKEYFKVYTYKKTIKSLISPELKERQRLVRYHEHDKVNQEQIVILCSIKGMTDFERKYTSKLYSMILGGSSNSILFDEVREKKSYCYYINSSVQSYDNILIINSGVDSSNTEKCLKLIKKCLTMVANGKISDEVISSSKETITSSIASSSDDPLAIINKYMSRVLVGSLSDEDRIKCFEKITKEELIKFAKKVKIHTILTLEKSVDDED